MLSSTGTQKTLNLLAINACFVFLATILNCVRCRPYKLSGNVQGLEKFLIPHEQSDVPKNVKIFSAAQNITPANSVFKIQNGRPLKNRHSSQVRLTSK